MENDAMLQQPNASEERNYIPIIVGLAVVVVVVAAIAFLGRSRGDNKPTVDPYAQKLQVTDMKLSQADNFVGSRVTYLDFTLTNTGDKTLGGGNVIASFKNTLGENVQNERLPLRALVPNQLGGYPDQLDLGLAPIAPGKSRTIRLTLEHVSGDWNQAAPDLSFADLRFK
jgi:hypothetical protein